MTFSSGKRGLMVAALAAGLVSVPAGSAFAVQPSAEQAKAASVEAARTKLFGAGYKNPNEVRTRAVANTTWLTSFGGTVVLQDSTIDDQITDTGDKDNNNGFVSVDDVVAAMPAAIFQDHTHFDQNHNLAEIATRTGSPVIIDLGGCLQTKVDAAEFGFDPEKVNCNLVRAADGRPFITPDSWAGSVGGYYSGQGLNLGIVQFTAYGEKGKPETAVPGLDEVEVAQVKHSPSFIPRPYANAMSGPNFDPSTFQGGVEDYQANPGEIPENLAGQGIPFDVEGSNLVWYIRYKDFTMVKHGSTGPTDEALEPGAGAIRKTLESWRDKGDRIDVELGSIAELTQFANGNYFEDAKQYATAIGAKMWFPMHHYNWYPFALTQPAETYFEGWTETWADGKREDAVHFPVQSCYLTENNYGTVWSFQVNKLKGDKLTAPRAITGPGCYTG